MDNAKLTIGTVVGITIIAVGIGLFMHWGPGSTADASHQPADRAAVSGSTLEIMESATANGSFSEVHTLLSTELRTSSPSDLILQFSSECAIWTDVTTVGNDESEAEATVNAWIEVDGERVPVSSDSSVGDNGEITLCNREYRVETMQFENENATIERFLRTKQANAFNWVDIDVGDGVHTVEVKAQLEGHAESLSEGNAKAKAIVGQRTLVIEPVKLANDAEL